VAFVVEDGTGLSTANAYISVATGDTHHADRGRTDWAAATNANREMAIVRATDYIDQRFGIRFIGEKGSGSQALEWPRLSAFDKDGYLLNGIPTQIEKACAEYALVSLRQGELAPNPPLPVPDQAVVGGGIVVGSVPQGEITREVVGPLETHWRSLGEARSSGAYKAPQSTMVSDLFLPEYPRADLWVEELLVSVSSRNLVRA
jgi:hypothetical protein